MAEYIDRQAAIDSLLGWAAQLTETYGKNDEYVRCLESAAYNIEQIPAADVIHRDEGIKLGAELAAMHGATPEQQQLEKAYFKGVEHRMTRRDVRPVVRGRWEYNPEDNIPYCFECMMPQDSECNYCPNCGADMREGE